MTRDIVAAVARGDGGFTVESLRLDAPGPGEALVRYVATGLCHTDLDVSAGNLPTPAPVVAGHEGVGVVEELGAGVGSVSVGDRVLLSIDSCGQCAYCTGGRVQYCPEHVPRNFLAQRADGSVRLRDAHGEPVHDRFFGQSAFATYGLAAERSMIRIDDTDIDATALAPLACGAITGVGAVTESLAVGPGSSVAVFGAGTVGLSALLAALAAGAERVVVVDGKPDRLALARELGATDAVDASSVDDLPAAVREVTGGVGVDHAVESSGAVALMAAAVESLAPLGHAVVLGFASMTAQIPVGAFGLLQGRSVSGSVMGDRTPAELVARTLALHADGRFPIERLVSTYPLADIATAVADVHSGAAVKAVLTMAG